MNIFYLDPRPDTAAEMHCDKHVVKMIIEYGQLLSTAHRVLDGDDAHPDLYRWHIKITQVRSGLDHPNNIMIGCFVCSEWSVQSILYVMVSVI